MSIHIKKVALAEQQSLPEGPNMAQNYLGIVNRLEVPCTVRIGTLTLTIGQLRELQLGQALTLKQKTNEPLDILVQDKVIARGELMCHEEHFAVQITEVCS